MPSTNSDSEKRIDVKLILAIALKRKWLLALPLVFVTAIAYGSSYFLTPIYESFSIIWIDKPHNVSSELISIIGREGGQRLSSDDRQRELQALQNEITSQTYLQALIQDLGLDNNPDLIRQAAQMREENPDRSLQELKLHLLMEQLRRRIAVAYVGQDQIKITVESGEPTLARDMVTRLTEILEREKTAYELEKILDNQTFADLQLQRTELEYQAMLDSLTGARAQLSKLQVPQSIASQENRREILADIENATQESTGLEHDRDAIMNDLRRFGLDNLRLHYTDTLVELRTEIDEQVGSYAAMMEQYAWSSQNVINVNIRLNDNVRLLERETERAVQSQYSSYPENQRQLLRRYFTVNENLDVVSSKVSQLRSSLDKIERRLDRLPALQAEIDELDRRLTEARRYRDAFRSEESTVEILSERAKDRTKYKIIEPARVPLVPVWPDHNRIIIMGMLLGLVIGGGAVFLAEMLDKSFKDVGDIEEALQLPVLATIPRIEKLRFNR
ncbi:MAG: hypothetical protein ABIE70_06615 [bacterium]